VRPSPVPDSAGPATPPVARAHPGMTRGLTLLFAVVGGVAVSNLYWAQPLLGLIADDLHVSTGTAGALVTGTQLGYAVGILLIVPLGDILDRRRLTPVMLLCSAVALLACAAAPTFGTLLAAVTLLGLTTVGGQIVPPLAGDLADDAHRGRVVSTVMAGFLAGTVVSRTISGLVAGAAGWRAIFAAAAVVVLVLAVLMYRSIPVLPARARVRYPELLASVGAVIRRHRVVRWTLVLSAIQFALFLMFWTALTFLLSAPPFSYPVSVIGLFGLLGLAGVVAAQRTGALHDRGWSIRATGIGYALLLVSFVLAGLAERSVLILVIAVVLLHVAIFPLNVLIATRLFALVPEGRSRVNTAMITVNFLAGAAGSAAVGVLWSAGGWRAVTVAEVALCAVGLAVWAVGRRGPLVAPAPAVAPIEPVPGGG
jgi:predicted MFS family arabinose efflux permease